MLNSRRNGRIRIFRVLVSLLIPLLVGAGEGTGQPPVSAGGWGNFSPAFSQFVKREKVTVLTEDSPFVDRLSKEKVEKLLSELQSSEPLTRYQAIASAYDYECSQEGSVLILRKRYSDINDLPFVTFEEARIALDHIERGLAHLHPPGPEIGWPGNVYEQFLTSLRPDQLPRLQTRGPITLLNAEQRQLLQTVCAKDFMETYATLSRINTWYMKQLTKPDTIFRWVEVIPKTPEILVLDGPLGFRGRRSQKGLSHGFGFQSGGPSGLERPRYSSPGKRPGFATSFFIRDWDAAQTKMWKDALTDLVDRTAPPPSAMPAPAPAARLTLGQLVERLTARAGGSESYQVDPALAPKPVCLFGSENAHPRAIFQSVARLYALDITQPTDNTFRLVVPRVGRVRGYNDVLPALRRCFPDPYQRYYHAQFKGRMAYMEQPENLSDFVKLLRKEDPNHPVALHSIGSRAAPYVQDTIYDTAVTRLRVEVEPRLAKSEDRQLKFRDAGVEAQRFFTLLCLVEIFSRLDAEASSFTTMPGVTDPNFGTWLGKFDMLQIQANISPDRMRTSLAIWDAKGERVLYRK